jgi:UPF0755 protein
MRRILSTLAALVVLLLLAAAAIAAYWLFTPYRGFPGETFVDIEHGTSSHDLARQLADKGVVRSEWAFLLVRLMRPTATLQAGEYRFASPQNPWQVFTEIQRGETFYEELTIPEGSNIFDIAGLLQNSGMVNADDFLRVAANTDLIRDLDPQAPTLEGYLFPSTYRVNHRTTADQLCRLMTTEFRRQWKLLNASSASSSQSADVHSVVTLASMIEKETGIPNERTLVAAVFLNRIKQGMPLQCDPTTVYASLLEKRYRGVIHRSDLASTNPYNTYTHAGLPPGPITNPGLASLQAALHPAEETYLYFVAKPDGSGSHHFSTTLSEHEKAVLAYRQGSH